MPKGTGGTAVAYDYDALNRLDGVNDAHVGCCTEYGYDAVGNLQSQSYPNGIASTYQYDVLNRLTNLTTLNGTSGLVAKYSYTVAPSGHRLTAAENVVITNTVRTINRIYSYDATYRLINEALSVTGPVSLPASANVGYALDDVGNRLSRTTSGFGPGTLDSTASTYDANDRLTSDTYDANGNTTTGHIPAGGTAVHDVYDFEDHLINRNSGQSTVTYDGDGNRVSKTVGGVTTFLVDDRNPSGYAQVLEEHTSLNSQPPALNRVYTYGSDLISQDQWTGSAWTLNFYGYDGHGNVRYLTATNAVVTDTFDYDAFGTLIAQSGATANNYLYCGEQFDADLGLYYNRARYLNADSDRFWSKDVFEGVYKVPLSLNSYLFGRGDGVNAMDRSGWTTVAESTEAEEVDIEVERNVYKKSGGQEVRRVVKRVTCWIGREGMEEALDLTFDTEWHHPINQGLGGPDANLVQLPSDLHRAFHSILNIFLRSNKMFQGLGNFSSEGAWAKWTQSKAGRRLILVEIKAASELIDTECSFRAPNSLLSYVKRNEKTWINEAPYP